MSSMISIVGYDVVGSASCDHGLVVVLNNNSDHYLVVETESMTGDVEKDGRVPLLLSTTGRLVASFEYGREALPAYRLALAKMVDVALANSADGEDEGDPDDDALAPHPDLECCPSCRCRPGDGLTDGCVDPNGCGYFRRAAEDASVAPPTK